MLQVWVIYSCSIVFQQKTTWHAIGHRAELALEPPDKDFGISCATLFWWSWVADASWLLTVCKILPPQFPSFASRSQSICADRRRTCLCSDRFCSCCWSVSSDGPLKEFRSRDSKLWGPLNATASPYSASCLVSRLQLVPLTTAFLFAPAGAQQSSPVLLQ